MLEDFEREHNNVFQEAVAIFKRRSAVRGQMWLDTSIEREFDMMDEKLKRARAAYEALQAARENVNKGEGPPSWVVDLEIEFEDSILDLMNFGNFAIKKDRRYRNEHDGR